jgi:hypothetical protein
VMSWLSVGAVMSSTSAGTAMSHGDTRSTRRVIVAAALLGSATAATAIAAVLAHRGSLPE